jgi:hypothetical protein
MEERWRQHASARFLSSPRRRYLITHEYKIMTPMLTTKHAIVAWKPEANAGASVAGKVKGATTCPIA